MKAILMTIGDELLIGQVIDTNSAWMGEKLNELGVQVVEKISVGDDSKAIQDALERSLNFADIILITGGLGPTKDDITKKSLAHFFNTKMEFHQPTWARIQGLFDRWGRSTTPQHKAQCYMPSNALLLENKMGTAPGMLFEFKDTIIVSMPGVPYEMKYIMENGVFPVIIDKNQHQHIIHKTIRTVGEGESRLAAKIEDITDNLPAHIKLAFLPSLGQVRLRLTGIGSDKSLIEKDIHHYQELIEKRISEFVFGYDLTTLEESIGRLCLEKRIKIATAESCTGGYIAHKITSIPGSSAYFMGSVVAYDNSIKNKILGVRKETLKKHGAVSEETVIEMLTGLLNLYEVDAGVSISGIAGPGGGSDAKPVGTVWIAYGDRDNIHTAKIRAGKDRLKNIAYSSTQALNLLRKFLIGQ